MNGFAREFTHDDNRYQIVRIAGSMIFRIFAQIQGIDDEMTFGHMVINDRSLSDLEAFDLIREYLIGEIDQADYEAAFIVV